MPRRVSLCDPVRARQEEHPGHLGSVVDGTMSEMVGHLAGRPTSRISVAWAAMMSTLDTLAVARIVSVPTFTIGRS